MSSPDLSRPVLSAGTITTLVGGTAIERAVAAAALAVGYRAGLEILPGWQVAGPGEVTFVGYEGSWLDWRSLNAFVADDAGIVLPWTDLDIRVAPFALRPLRTRDPVAQAFWTISEHKDVAAAMDEAEASSRNFVPRLDIMFCGSSGAGDWWMAEQCRRLSGRTALLVTAPTAFTEPSEFAEWAGSFGSVVLLDDFRDQVSGVSAFLAHPPAALVPVPRRRQLLGADASAKGDVEAFLTAQGVEALRAIFTDGSSAESRRLKALARAQGITPGRLWHAAKRFADDALRSYELAFREATDSGLGILYGYAAVFNQWREVNSPVKGNYLQRIASGAFAETIEANLAHMKVILQHGEDPHVGYKPLGPISVLEEDDYGLRYEVQLLDVGYVRHLVPWLHTGLYGGSLSFEVTADDFTVRPGKSAHNPRGIPEQTVREIRVQEFGPVYPPAYAGTSAGVRPR